MWACGGMVTNQQTTQKGNFARELNLNRTSTSRGGVGLTRGGSKAALYLTEEL